MFLFGDIFFTDIMKLLEKLSRNNRIDQIVMEKA
jgi:hypothetical protein